MAGPKLIEELRDLSWAALNDLVRNMTNERRLYDLLQAQLSIPNAPTNRAQRIYGRLSVVRRERELAEIKAKGKAK